MKRTHKILLTLLIVIFILSCCTVPAMAVTTSEVQDKVNAVGKSTVTGNIFIWFLCAIAFLKISQKIDSFMSSLGINVGHTGGSMLSEMLIAARGISMAGRSYGRGGAGGSSGGSGSVENTTFLQGGLAGAVSRSFVRGGIKNATGSSSGGLGGLAYNSSLNKGGGFANRVIGNIATGRLSSEGSITGQNAPAALMSYMGYSAGGDADAPSFSDVEIGGGHIFGTETSAEHPDGIAMGMYNTEQYMAPEGNYTVETATDGTTWYKQYASPAVDRVPYQASDGSIAYNESIRQRLPKAPPRKDRV